MSLFCSIIIMHCLFNLHLVTDKESNDFAYRPAFHFHTTFVQSKLEQRMHPERARRTLVPLKGCGIETGTKKIAVLIRLGLASETDLLEVEEAVEMVPTDFDL